MTCWDFFDTILYINLPHRKDRNEQALTEFERVGLKADCIDGILDDNRTKGFNQAQRNALQAANGRALILEDDVIFKNYEHLEAALYELPEDWDLLYLGANIVGTDLCSWPTPEYHSQHLRRITQAWTTHAVAYSPKGLERILELWKDQSDIYDDILRQNLEKLNAFIVNPMVADQRIGYSDIWQRPTDYGFFKQGNERMAI